MAGGPLLRAECKTGCSGYGGTQLINDEGALRAGRGATEVVRGRSALDYESMRWDN